MVDSCNEMNKLQKRKTHSWFQCRKFDSEWEMYGIWNKYSEMKH